MPLFEANVRVIHDECWTVEANDIEGARRKFQLFTDDVQDDDSGGPVVEWEVYAVTELKDIKI